MPKHRLLFIDAYDSFSNNIIALLREQLLASVDIIKIDDQRFVLNDDAFYKFLDGFDAVVAGPGPGDPSRSADVGLISKLWHLPEDHIIPVLGICLGFQSLALEFGGIIDRLTEPRHGFVTQVLHCGDDIFEGAGDILATQYHSLHAKLGHDISDKKLEDLWRPSQVCKELIPLAWDLGDAANGPVLASIRHCHLPLWGVQYHPESICTNEEGRKLVLNWWEAATAWRATNRRTISGPLGGLNTISGQECGRFHAPEKSNSRTVQWTSVQLPSEVAVTDVLCTIRADCGDYEPILLESGTRQSHPVNTETGRFSIIGVHDCHSTHVKYSISSHRLEVERNGDVVISRSATITDVFEYIEEFVQEHKGVDGPKEVPFWAGLIGFVSYEAGLESVDIAPSTSQEQPDVWFVFVERSIVIDHVNRTAYVQSIRKDDTAWLAYVGETFCQCKDSKDVKPSSLVGLEEQAAIIYSPEGHEYREKVRQCDDHLRAGSSYELCLTDTTVIRSDAEPWSLYSRLREVNPAPFGAYLRLSTKSPGIPGLSLISSSPERFLSWSRARKCQFRPIKGTVKKGPCVTLESATKILSSAKEQAENLMIVDLIRHDLNGATGANDVRVHKLMSVEEYESVFQLVSVIEGDLDGSGIPVLAASLPPGSMTGAPKKRSCDLLETIEGEKSRGLYSGVLGYFDVGGGGDFSVVIRSAFKWDGEDWQVGAGGAVTALSDAEAEWQEMLAKRQNVLRAFGLP